jgi:hypothetical protein
MIHIAITGFIMLAVATAEGPNHSFSSQTNQGEQAISMARNVVSTDFKEYVVDVLGCHDIDNDRKLNEIELQAMVQRMIVGGDCPTEDISKILIAKDLSNLQSWLGKGPFVLKKLYKSNGNRCDLT